MPLRMGFADTLTGQLHFRACGAGPDIVLLPYSVLYYKMLLADRPREFDQLLRILDGELRLVTPTEADGESSRFALAESSAGAERSEASAKRPNSRP